MKNTNIKYINKFEHNNENFVRIVTSDGKAYKHNLFIKENKNCFIYNKGIYSCMFSDKGFAYDVEYVSANRVDESTVEKIVMLPGSENPFGEQTEWNEPEAEVEEPDVDEEPKEEPKADEPEVVHHKEYDTIKACVENNVPVYLAGPAGSGKNFTLEQIANELGMKFYFSNSIQQEYKLTGFIDAGGKYHETEFYKAATDDNECIFFLDEMDASIPEVLVLLNAAIANGYFEFPNGKVTLKHVHFVAAGNTVGSGADDKYTGRMVLDQATLDRFAIIEFGYDMNIEFHLANGNASLVDFIHELRDVADASGIRTTFSYRCITMVVKLSKTGMNMEKILKIAVVKGLDKDTINTLRLNGSSEYHRALRNIQMAA